MKIAVTGAGGFVGRHVLAVLRRKAVPCIAIDLSTPKDASSSSVQWLPMDIHSPPENAFQLMGRPDACIHLAWGGLPNYKSAYHIENELPAQYRFLNALIRGGLSALVVSGTCLEYGMQTGALSEEMESRPDNPYGRAKDELRKQLQLLHESIPFALTWARLFYVYGEGQSANSLWSQINQAVTRGDALFPMSGGKQLRDYMPIEKVAEHLVTLALSKTNGGIVNVCSGRPVSVREVVDGWIGANGWTIKPDLGRYPYPDYEPMEFWGVATKLKGILGALCR